MHENDVLNFGGGGGGDDSLQFPRKALFMDEENIDPGKLAAL